MHARYLKANFYRGLTVIDVVYREYNVKVVQKTERDCAEVSGPLCGSFPCLVLKLIVSAWLVSLLVIEGSSTQLSLP